MQQKTIDKTKIQYTKLTAFPGHLRLADLVLEGVVAADPGPAAVALAAERGTGVVAVEAAAAVLHSGDN